MENCTEFTCTQATFTPFNAGAEAGEMGAGGVGGADRVDVQAEQLHREDGGFVADVAVHDMALD